MAPRSRTRKHDQQKLERGGRLAWVLLLVLLAGALAYSVATANGPSNFGDDLAYSWYAHAAAQGRFVQNTGDILSVRILQIYPIGFFYLFGVSLLTSSAWDILSFIGTLAVVFLLGRELYSEYAGLLAALLLAFMPTVLQISGTMSDNIPMMFLASLAMLALLYAQRLKSRKWYLVSGTALVASFLVMPEGLFAWAIVLLYLIARFIAKGFKADRNSQYLLYGMVASVVVLLAFNYATIGRPLISFTFTFSYFQTHSYSYFTPANSYLGFYPNVMFPYHVLSALWSAAAYRNLGALSTLWGSGVTYNIAGFYFYAAILAAALLALRREKRAYFVLFWFVVGFLIMEFDPYHVSLSPFSYMLQHRLDRYLTLIAPAAVLMISIAAMRAIDGTKKRNRKYLVIAAAALVFLFLILTAIPIDRLWQSLQLYERYSQFQIAKYLNALPDSTRVYFASGQPIPVYMGFRNQSRLMVYDQLDNCSQLMPNSYIALPLYSKVGSTSYTPLTANSLCPGWVPALPFTAPNVSQQVASVGAFAQTQLYYIPSNST